MLVGDQKQNPCEYCHRRGISSCATPPAYLVSACRSIQDYEAFVMFLDEYEREHEKEALDGSL